MIISTNINYSQTTPCVVALGCFDGVHLGHASVISRAKENAISLNVPLCIWSFAEPPKRFYAKDTIPLLSNSESKADIIENLGADIYISVKFDQEIASVSAEDFFNNILIDKLNAVSIVCGYDFSFGRGGKGNSALLYSLCNARGIEFISVESINIGGESVSSSKIREYIQNANIEKANLLLGRPYSIKSTVIDGKHLGRKLGFPTINQKIDKDLCKPANGVYLTRVTIDKNIYFGITNVGSQPTVLGSDILIETNVFEVTGNFYGKEILVEFLRFIRHEQKFNSINELVIQVNKDISTAKEMSDKYKKSTE